MSALNRISTKLHDTYLSGLSIKKLQIRLSNRVGATGLCYHSISYDYPDYPYTTSPEAFEQHIKFLSETFEILPLHDVVDALKTGDLANYCKPLAFITFDDAYRDNLYTATPILEAFNIPATLFAPRDLVRHDNKTHMSEDDIKSIASHPLWDVGAHGLSHNPLTALAIEDVWRELTDSRQWLESLVGKPATAFAYPLGSINHQIVETARELYSYAMSTNQNTSDTFDALQIRRYCPTKEDDAIDIFAKSLLMGPYEII